jgi:hypothetical protein
VSLEVEIAKLSNERHLLRVRRADSSAEEVELETRSYLLHDLVHWAIEAESSIDDGFWGLLAQGVTLEALADRTMTEPLSPGLALAERLVGPFQAVHNERLAASRYVEQARGVAPFVDEAWVERVSERLRRLTGAWRAVTFSQALALRWPPLADPVVIERRR